MKGGFDSSDSPFGRWVFPAVGVVVTSLVGGIILLGRGDRPKAEPAARPAAVSVAKPEENLQTASLEGLVEPVRAGRADALGLAYQRSAAMPSQPELLPPAPTTGEIASWKRLMQATAESLDKFQPEARIVAMKMAGRMLGLLGRDNVAANWSDLLDPVRETIAKGTTDKNCDVRAAAIEQVAMIWEWVPGRDIFTVERNTLAAWKGGMLQLVQPFLKDAEIPARLAAMRALSALPIDMAAAPALELLNDKEPFVRAELIRYFAPRTGLIPDEQLLGLLYNEEPMVRAASELALKSRGLSDVQIGLGKMIVSPDPLVRSSVIGKLDESMDVDAGVWLARLVEDKDAAVRLKAVEAIAKRKVSGDLIRRLQVISEKDASDAVRKSAEKVVRAQSNASLASPLPPLPKADRQPAAARGAGSVIRAN